MSKVEMTAEAAKELREPFTADVVGKLPRVWCRQCGEARKHNGHGCDKHQRVRCRVCGNNITEAHLHLDYVGHAEVTDRFLQVDPWWDWEPLALSPDGLPLIDQHGGLWIRLTIAGVTRLGYGHADGKQGPDAVKETIGDALRNAGMRFGVGLDLWGAKHKDGGGPQPSTHDMPEVGWENAQPARRGPTREQVMETGHARIATAGPEQLAELTARVAAFEADETITTDDAASLMAAIKAREVELAGNGAARPAEAVSSA